MKKKENIFYTSLFLSRYHSYRYT